MQKRPKLHVGAPRSTSSPTKVGGVQFRWAVPVFESPAGWQWTASCWLLTVGVFPLLNKTSRSPFGSTIGSEPWSKLHAAASLGLCVKKSPNWQRLALAPLISSGCDDRRPWFVDIEP